MATEKLKIASVTHFIFLLDGPGLKAPSQRQTLGSPAKPLGSKEPSLKTICLTLLMKKLRPRLTHNVSKIIQVMESCV